MNATHDVITDLLPLYLAGEASEGSRALVDAYLRQHPDFAAAVRERAETSAAALASLGATLPDEHEKIVLDRTRRFNRRRAWLMGVAIWFSLLPFATVFTDEIRWMLMRDHPRQATMYWIAGAVCWVGYYRLGRRLRSLGEQTGS